MMGNPISNQDLEDYGINKNHATKLNKAIKIYKYIYFFLIFIFIIWLILLFF